MFMSTFRFVLLPLLRLCFGVFCLFLIFFCCSFLFSPTPNIEAGSSVDLQAQQAELATLKDQSVDPDNVLRVQVDVDYSEGESAAWFPKAESPILTSLVAKGTLPPVVERVGKEPMILKGLHGAANYGGSMYRLNSVPAPRITPINLIRYSPQGFPIVPNVAKSWTVSEDGRRFTFTLRKGMKWSDGHPY
ncbi:MAG: hypothetical protein D3925_10840, partial [Candidatus Electrothrix sp. AR5]|nr:hypothetical protein [Candidatus Electrothrix sp. AR5]